MVKELYILFTSGRGPLECGLALQGIQNKFQEHLKSKQIAYKIISQEKGITKHSLNTIIFKIKNKKNVQFDSWLGTIQWICKSPIRPNHKRKNWYIKCQIITKQEQLDIDTSNVITNTFRASGPGGQHRNKVETAVRLICRNSGIIVTASDGKSQTQNKKKAYQKLEEKLRNENDKIQNGFNMERWNALIKIERGNPIKTFKGLRFKSLS